MDWIGIGSSIERQCLISLYLGLSLLGSHGVGPDEMAHAGSLEGKVHYLGTQPKPTVMKVTKDQDHCGSEVSVQTIHLHGEDGVLRAAVVSVEGLKQEASKAQTERPVLNMQCAFSPRIGIAIKGQEIEVRNQDPILHNTHIKLGKRTFLNVAQVPGGKPIVKRLKRQGIHAIRCDKHVFMKAYLHVFSHPFHALTNQSGAFRIENIPSGDHVIRVWHETLGTLEKTVKIPEKGAVRLDFSFPSIR